LGYFFWILFSEIRSWDFSWDIAVRAFEEQLKKGILLAEK
jgi:hypothetical protein